ncbi:MAG: Mrp/NBP35 family ATP-binding protein [Lachnospiraceae bacterium]|nr:Mrp/NBP35 family ATP-binding protein [Lachnospiraceae bacterium]
MSEDCNKSDCGSCGVSGCPSRRDPLAKDACNEGSSVGQLIAVISGKGGVGKSQICALLANALRASGKKAGILDADITGPSIARMYGIHGGADSDGKAVLPKETAGGLKIMSINMLLEHEEDPVIWRGPIISSTVRQFWTEVAWGELDYLLLDMPPGTGDVPLTVFQSLPVDGIVVVTSPQELVSMVVAKAVHMAQAMNVPILGLVENMAYFDCPDCGKRHEFFGKSHAREVAARYGIEHVMSLPILPANAALCDEGRGDELDASLLGAFAEEIEAELKA